MTPFRELLDSLWTAIRSARVWCLLWLALTLIALPSAITAATFAEGDAARWPVPTVLPADGDTFAGLRLDLVGPLLLAFTLGVFFIGGILGVVGKTPRLPMREFLAAGARGFLANLGVIAIFVIPALLLGWAIDVLDDALRQRWIVRGSPGATFDLLGLKLRWAYLLAAWDVARGVLFLGLLFLSKIAMATVARGPGRSAWIAALRAPWIALRHPWRVTVAVLTWPVIWVGGSLLFGELTVRFLEVRGSVLLGAVFGELGILFAVCGWIGFTLHAKRVAEI